MLMLLLLLVLEVGRRSLLPRCGGPSGSIDQWVRTRRRLGRLRRRRSLCLLLLRIPLRRVRLSITRLPRRRALWGTILLPGRLRMRLRLRLLLLLMRVSLLLMLLMLRRKRRRRTRSIPPRPRIIRPRTHISVPRPFSQPITPTPASRALHRSRPWILVVPPVSLHSVPLGRRRRRRRRRSLLSRMRRMWGLRTWLSRGRSCRWSSPCRDLEGRSRRCALVVQGVAGDRERRIRVESRRS